MALIKSTRRLPVSSMRSRGACANGSAESAFGGCNRLLTQYRTIGRELLRTEGNRLQYRCDTARIAQEFREGVCFVGLEVLESYLEDLLDREVSEESLFIARKGWTGALIWIALAGILCAVAAGLCYGSSGASLVESSSVTLALSLPFVVLWQVSPYSGLVRRLSFARTVSHEISRRRGVDKDRQWSSARYVFAELFRAPPESAKGAACSASRCASSPYHVFH
jgi:hypothetical protein